MLPSTEARCELLLVVFCALLMFSCIAYRCSQNRGGCADRGRGETRLGVAFQNQLSQLLATGEDVLGALSHIRKEVRAALI